MTSATARQALSATATHTVVPAASPSPWWLDGPVAVPAKSLQPGMKLADPNGRWMVDDDVMPGAGRRVKVVVRHLLTGERQLLTPPAGFEYMVVGSGPR